MMGVGGPTIHSLSVEAAGQGNEDPPVDATGINGFPMIAGTPRGLSLRLFQLAAAAAAGTLMILTAAEFLAIEPTRCVAGALAVQIVWSLWALGTDAYALTWKCSLHNKRALMLLVIGDLVAVSLLLFAVSLSTGSILYMVSDLNKCSGNPSCGQFGIVIMISFCSCILDLTSLVFSFWALNSIWLARFYQPQAL